MSRLSRRLPVSRFRCPEPHLFTHETQTTRYRVHPGLSCCLRCVHKHCAGFVKSKLRTRLRNSVFEALVTYSQNFPLSKTLASHYKRARVDNGSTIEIPNPPIFEPNESPDRGTRHFSQTSIFEATETILFLDNLLSLHQPICPPKTLVPMYKVS